MPIRMISASTAFGLARYRGVVPFTGGMMASW